MTNTKLQTEDAPQLVNEINSQQYSRFDSLTNLPKVGVLFNKGRYFEMSVYDKDLIEKISKESGAKIEFENMLVGPKGGLEDLVKTFNDNGYFVNITLDWI